MSMSDCEMCWNTPCSCGHEWERFSDDELNDFIKIFERIIQYRNNPKGKEVERLRLFTLKKEELRRAHDEFYVKHNIKDMIPRKANDE